MDIEICSGNLKPAIARIGGVFAAAALAGFVFTAPALASEHSHHHHHNIVIMDDDGDMIEHLIEMDADDIQDMREEFADARADIKDAIADIEDAREEAKDAPGGEFFLKIAFTTARTATSVAIRKALKEVRDEIDDAEHDLAAADVSDEERVETQQAIDVFREELASLEVALDELVEALKS